VTPIEGGLQAAIYMITDRNTLIALKDLPPILGLPTL